MSCVNTSRECMQTKNQAVLLYVAVTLNTNCSSARVTVSAGNFVLGKEKNLQQQARSETPCSYSIFEILGQ